MARLGLGGWRCLFANDFDPVKASVYRNNHGGEHLVEGDVWALSAADLPGRADLAWASSPCQDFSLAGRRAGLEGGRSSAFWGFWRLIEELESEGRGPRALVIENVTGLLTSADGADFTALCQALGDRGWRFGAIELDAALWLPQSRPRLFLIATREPDPTLTQSAPAAPFHSGRIVAAHGRLPEPLKDRWVWWRFAAPARRNVSLADLLEPDSSVRWMSAAETERLLTMMSPANRLKLTLAQSGGERAVGAVYRRVRSENGRRVQRAEVRFDGLSGCLRTPAGGSSRQILLMVEAQEVRARRMTAREAARLMGLPDDYRLPASDMKGLKVAGDGVAVPVVRALARQLLEPLLLGRAAEAA